MFTALCNHIVKHFNTLQKKLKLYTGQNPYIINLHTDENLM